MVLLTCSTVILRSGDPPPIAAYPSALFGARTVEINVASGRCRKLNSLGNLMMSCEPQKLLRTSVMHTFLALGQKAESKQMERQAHRIREQIIQKRLHIV